MNTRNAPKRRTPELPILVLRHLRYVEIESGEECARTPEADLRRLVSGLRRDFAPVIRRLAEAGCVRSYSEPWSDTSVRKRWFWYLTWYGREVANDGTRTRLPTAAVETLLREDPRAYNRLRARGRKKH